MKNRDELGKEAGERINSSPLNPGGSINARQGKLRLIETRDITSETLFSDRVKRGFKKRYIVEIREYPDMPMDIALAIFSRDYSEIPCFVNPSPLKGL